MLIICVKGTGHMTYNARPVYLSSHLLNSVSLLRLTNMSLSFELTIFSSNLLPEYEIMSAIALIFTICFLLILKNCFGSISFSICSSE
jgi:hypothetical protein